MCLFCNKDLFDQAGVEIPTTYDELITAGEALAKLDGVTPLAIGAKDAWLAGALYESLALREVGASEVQSALLGETESQTRDSRKQQKMLLNYTTKESLARTLWKTAKQKLPQTSSTEKLQCSLTEAGSQELRQCRRQRC